MVDQQSPLVSEASRASVRIPKTYTLDGESVDILNTLVGHPRGHGAYISRLLHEDRARREERARLHQLVTTALGGTDAARNGTGDAEGSR